MQEAESIESWAQETFGEAQLGDPRRVARLVSMGAAAANQPAGKVTQVFSTVADREGAFRFLESSASATQRVCDAVFDSTAKQSASERLLFVAVDATTLTLTDRKKRRDLGRVGPRFPTRGLHVMTALGIDESGAVRGLLDQCWWARPPKRRGKRLKSFKGDPRKKETVHWLDALTHSHERLQQHAPNTRVWYQLDRGADGWPVLSHALKHKLLITVRNAHDRRLYTENGRPAYLRQTLKSQRILGHYSLQIPARDDRKARTARLVVRACKIMLHARVGSHRREILTLNAVSAEEVGYRGKDRIRWILLTTAPVETFEQARAVVSGYALRWRVEDFHRTWKRGLCCVEDTQLQSRGAILKWATILAAVAARALRLANLLRTTPDIPATDEFTEYEIDAAFLLLKRKRDRRRRLSFAEVIDMLAELGGFAHKYSKTYNLPGPTILGRGLNRIQPLALGLKNIAEM